LKKLISVQGLGEDPAGKSPQRLGN